MIGRPSANDGWMTTMNWAFDNTHARELQGLYVPAQPAASPQPRLRFLNCPLAHALGLDADALATDAGVAVLAGNVVPATAQPLAQAYAGHQFGHYSPQLGDGRALLLGELVDHTGVRRDIAFKGSGRTPFSRGGDGKAALGPVLREVLMGEAMHALGIPTTRALAAVTTGEVIFREGKQPGAVLTRVAASHLRVGSVQFFAHIDDGGAMLRRLVDHAIARHDPHLLDAGDPERYLLFLQTVVQRQASLLAQWMGVGFIHGVMNTDNMALSGETIDYGPCAFLEHHDPAAVFSSIDTQGRYAYGRQPVMAQWNLARLAEALLPLIDADTDRAIAQASEVVNRFQDRYAEQWHSLLRRKVGLAEASVDATESVKAVETVEAVELGASFLTLLREHKVDHTLGFWHLANAPLDTGAGLQGLFGAAAPALALWLHRWHVARGGQRLAPQACRSAMLQVNPLVVPRNHRVEAALAAAVNEGDDAPFEQLLAAVRQPFAERALDDPNTQPAPAAQTAAYRTFCGT